MPQFIEIRTVMKTYSIILFLITSLNFAPSLIAQESFERRLHETFEQTKNLTKDMGPEQFEAIVGKPDNADWNQSFKSDGQNVKIWLRVAQRGQELASWRNYVNNYEKFGQCYFFLFVNNRLFIPVPYSHSEDKNILVGLAKQTVGSIK